MHPPTVRVVLDNQPYLLVLDEDGAPSRVHGPFSPGTEPGFSLCRSENEVRDPKVVKRVIDLAPRSPTLPDGKDTMADA